MSRPDIPLRFNQNGYVEKHANEGKISWERFSFTKPERSFIMQNKPKKPELWTAIDKFEGYYEISNHGRVRSIDRLVIFRNNKGKRFYKGKILKQKYHDGYAMVNLNINKDMKTLYVHHLVADHFVPNPNNLPVRNHDDGVKSNNYYENIIWCTSAENNIHALEKGLRTNNISGILESNIKNSKQVAALKNNKIVAIKSCSRDLALHLLEEELLKEVSIETVSRAIRSCANDSNKSYHGFKFQFIEFDLESSI